MKFKVGDIVRPRGIASWHGKIVYIDSLRDRAEVAWPNGMYAEWPWEEHELEYALNGVEWMMKLQDEAR